MAGQLRPHDVLVYVKEELIELAIDECLFILIVLTKACLERRIHKWKWEVSRRQFGILEISNREAVILEV